MTKRRTTTSWRGALYMALAATQGGVAGFCAWAGALRGRTLAESTLYKRLDGSYPGERIPIEDAELITEYVLSDVNGRQFAHDWIRALGNRWGLVIIDVDGTEHVLPPSCDLELLVSKSMKLFEEGGRLAGLISRASADRQICREEGAEIVGAIDAAIALLLRARRLVCRLCGLEGDQ